MNTRKLSLKREALAELSVGELSVVVGGTHAGCAATDDCTHTFDIATVKGCHETVPDYYCLTIAGPRCIY